MHGLVEPILLTVFFLSAATLIYEISKRWNFPYVVALLLLGFAAHWATAFFGFHNNLHLSPEVIFFVLLPLLLFGAALHLNFHQFRLQFKTITFLATFGLMLSIAVVGVLMSLLLGLPIEVGLLFGTIISATDPIAVLAIFKSLGAPRRLALIADGESMFNDATAVIAFRVMMSIALGTTAVSPTNLLQSAGVFVYTFVGSIVIGALVGLLASLLIERIKNDAFVETTITVVTAFGVFLGAEHFLHLSGVIATVVAGLVVGNLGTTKISGGVIHFIEDFWDYVGMLAIAVVFFFAAYELDVSIFAGDPWSLVLVIVTVLVARALSVYASILVTNNVRFFNDEPDIYLSWQHVLNWGGLRGVIPLVLVFALPDDFIYKNDLLVYTLGVLMFSLFVNGLTIEWLLKTLRLHVPRKEEAIMEAEERIFDLEKAEKMLHHLPDVGVEEDMFVPLKKQVQQQLAQQQQHLIKMATQRDLLTSLRLQALNIERSRTKKLFYKGIIYESVFYDLMAQYDLQQDALEYPDLYKARHISKDGKIHTHQSFRRWLRRLREWAGRVPFGARLLQASREQMIIERYMLVKARIAGNEAVMEYLESVGEVYDSDKGQKVLEQVVSTYQEYLKNNKLELMGVVDTYGYLVKRYQQQVLAGLVR